jgi:hypothetical protein
VELTRGGAGLWVGRCVGVLTSPGASGNACFEPIRQPFPRGAHRASRLPSPWNHLVLQISVSSKGKVTQPRTTHQSFP